MSANQSILSDWVETYTNELYSWALHKVSDSNLAQDLVQDTFLAASEKIDGFEGKSSPKTWLFSILNYKIIDVYRRRNSQPERVDGFSMSKFFDEEGNWNQSGQPREWEETDEHLLDNDDFCLF